MAGTRRQRQHSSTKCPAFPADNVWNTRVAGLPVDSHSVQWLANMAAGSAFLHPDYGPGGGASPYGIPWQITRAQPQFVQVHFQYADESDPGSYPFAAGAPIEGGSKASGDRHAIMVDPATCTLFELYDAHYHPDNRQ